MYGSSFLDGTLNSDTPGVVLDEEQPYIAQFPPGIINLNTDQYQNKKVIKFTKWYLYSRRLITENIKLF